MIVLCILLFFDGLCQLHPDPLVFKYFLFCTLVSGYLLHELSNDGAKNQFQEFLHECILPVMVSSAKVVYCRITASSRG